MVGITCISYQRSALTLPDCHIQFPVAFTRPSSVHLHQHIRAFNHAWNHGQEQGWVLALCLDGTRPSAHSTSRFLGIFWKCARVGERLSPYISICCVFMAVSFRNGPGVGSVANTLVLIVYGVLIEYDQILGREGSEAGSKKWPLCYRHPVHSTTQGSGITVKAVKAVITTTTVAYTLSCEIRNKARRRQDSKLRLHSQGMGILLLKGNKEGGDRAVVGHFSIQKMLLFVTINFSFALGKAPFASLVPSRKANCLSLVSSAIGEAGTPIKSLKAISTCACCSLPVHSALVSIEPRSCDARVEDTWTLRDGQILPTSA